MLSNIEVIKSRGSSLIRNYRECKPMNALDYEVFLKTYLPYQSAKNNRSYPYTVKLPKSTEEMLAGDFSPSREIVIEGPIVYEGNEIWTGNTSKDIELHLGYQNGDKRYLSRFTLNGKTEPHGGLAGSTGSGKSVTFNIILFNMLFNYAPWEFNLWMEDAKITEFKRYGIEHHIPHIKSIAATEDTNYLISVLDKYEEDMLKLNAVFAAASVTNLTEFREKTGLTIPRQLLAMDEVTAMFQREPKKAPYLEKKIANVAALGRNTGYHLLVASQSVDSNMTNIMNTNIAVRLCLKCNDTKISNMILGNDQGALGDVGNGKIYVNQNPSRGDKSDNVKFRVPLQDAGQFSKHGKFLEECGKRVDFSLVTNFYNEDEKILEDKFKSLCGLKKDNGLIIGVPSFVCDTPDRFELEFKYKDVENILVYAQSIDDCYRYFKTMYLNAIEDRSRGVKHRFLIGDDEFIRDLNPKEDGFICFDISETDSAIWLSTVRSIYVLNILQEIDKYVFNRLNWDDESDEDFDNLINDLPRSDVNRSRMYYARALLTKDKNMKMFNLNSISNKERLTQKINETLQFIFSVVKGLGSEFSTTQITKECLPKNYLHVVGVQKIYGMGRDTKTNDLENIKKFLQDACKANYVVICYTSNMEDFTGCATGFRYFLLDKVSKYSAKVKCTEYPNEVRPVCCVFYDLQTLEVKTFKRLSLSISD